MCCARSCDCVFPVCCDVLGGCTETICPLLTAGKGIQVADAGGSLGIDMASGGTCTFIVGIREGRKDGDMKRRVREGTLLCSLLSLSSLQSPVHSSLLFLFFTCFFPLLFSPSVLALPLSSLPFTPSLPSLLLSTLLLPLFPFPPLQSSGEPVGVIVLERCHVERVQHDSRPYTFALGKCYTCIARTHTYIHTHTHTGEQCDYKYMYSLCLV